MLEYIDILLEYFNVFKNIELKNENSKSILNNINSYIEILNNVKNRTDKIKYIRNYDEIENITKRYDSNAILNELYTEYNISNEHDLNDVNIPSYIKEMILSSKKGIDSILNDIMLNLNKYTVYLMNKKIKSQDVLITKNIEFEDKELSLKDVLSYLEVDEKDLDERLISDLKRNIDLEKFKNMASQIKTDMGLSRILFEKIDDKNILLAIMLHSNINIIRSVCDICSKMGLKVNNLAGIPFIFIRNLINSKCKYNVPTHYDDFVYNIQICEKYGVDLKRMFNNHHAFLTNDREINSKIIETLLEKGANVKHVLENAGGVVAANPNIVFKNIDTVSLYGISLTDDNCNNGYTILGMETLDEKLDSHIEKGLWKKSDGETLDNMDLTKGLRIKEGYLNWKNNYKCDTLDTTSLDKFTNESFSDEKLEQIYEKYPEIKNIIEKLDSIYLVKDGYYAIGVNIVSRLRVLRNLCNYNGKAKGEEIFFEALEHNSNISNSEEVIKAIKQTLEMGDESVKLSKGL